MRLEAKELAFSYHQQQILRDLSLHVGRGEFVGLIGPNGSGKSTLIKTIYRSLYPDFGEIHLDGANLLTMRQKQIAQSFGVVGQEHDVNFDFTVLEMVSMGRAPHKGLLESLHAHDKHIVFEALRALGLEHMVQVQYTRLSGGEKQRVIIARALAQESDFLLLDEPANHLDIGYQLQIFDLVKHLKRTTLAAMHDLNMAALYCDRLYALKDGQVLYEGSAAEVLTAEHIFQLYGVHCDTAPHPVTGKLCITYFPSEQYQTTGGAL